MLLIMAKIFSGHNFKKWPKLFYSAVWWSVILQQDLFIILTCGLCRKKCWKSFSQICHQIYVILVVWIINDLEHNKMSLIFKKKICFCLFVSFMKFRSKFEYRLVYWEHQCSEQNWSLNWICADEQLSESAAMAHVQPLKKSIRRWSWVYK